MTPVEPAPIISNILSANHQLVPDDDQVKVWELQLKLIWGAFGDKSPQCGRGRLLDNDLDLPPPPHKHDVFHHMKLASGRVLVSTKGPTGCQFPGSPLSTPVWICGALCRPPASKRLNQETQLSWSLLYLLATYYMSEETSLLIILVLVLPFRDLFAYFTEVYPNVINFRFHACEKALDGGKSS